MSLESGEKHKENVNLLDEPDSKESQMTMKNNTLLSVFRYLFHCFLGKDILLYLAFLCTNIVILQARFIRNVKC